MVIGKELDADRSGVISVSLHNFGEILVLIHRPQARAEDLDFVEAVEAGRLDPGANLPERNATFTHEAAIEEEIDRRCAPVADMVREEGVEPAAAGDFGFERRVPPKMVNVGGDADLARLECFNHIIGLAERIHGRAGIGIHRMQRLDRELHAGGLAIGEERGDAVEDLFARFGERLAGYGAADEYNMRSTERMRFGDGAAIIIERLGAVGRGNAGEKSSTTERDNGKTVIAKKPAGLRDIATGERVAPDRDAPDTGRGVFGGRDLDRPRLGGDRVDTEAAQIGKG